MRMLLKRLLEPEQTPKTKGKAEAKKSRIRFLLAGTLRM